VKGSKLGIFMKRHWETPLILIVSLVLLIGLSSVFTTPQAVLAQIPTVDIPTVTGTPSGPIVTVKQDAGENQINVRAGPGTYYDKVGVLLLGQTAPAKGKSSGGDWILIEYIGAPNNAAWVHAPLVSIPPGTTLPVVEPPPTPTPQVTNTIDPTLAAQFIITVAPTRLPTFTAPPPLAIPTFQAVSASQQRGGIPMGLVIISLAAVGLFIGLFSLAQRR
jgi:hypothetical protein